MRNQTESSRLENEKQTFSSENWIAEVGQTLTHGLEQFSGQIEGSKSKIEGSF